METSGMANDPAVIGSLTTIHLILIALLALVVIGIIVLASRVRSKGRHQRHDSAEASERLAELHDVRPAAAPVPPPATDTPVVATAPLDANPATLAADIVPPGKAPAPIGRVLPEDTGGDDLTRMKGVGPKLATRLAELGFGRFAAIAALDATGADALDAQLGNFKGRLARDRVVEQAGYLAKGDVAGFESVFGRLG